MIALANFIMRGPLQAYGVATIAAILAIFFTPIGVLAGIVIALITLRVGNVEGAKTMAAAAVVHLALTFLMSGSYAPGLVVIIQFMLPVWIIALVLRNTNSLGLALQATALLAGAGLVLAHLLIGDLAQWWFNLFNQVALPLLEDAGVSYPVETIEQMTKMITMLLAMFAALLWYGQVLIARWLQAALYYPGQFQKDFHRLTLPKPVAWTTFAIATASLFMNEWSGGLLGNLFGLLTIILMFQGIAIIHHAVSVKQASKGWLIAMYILLFVFPQAVLVLAIIGMADTFSDFRSRWEPSN
ncbi:hypothetical protein THIAE_04930 [Thiomicrospira aerophila AL3]|uniref:DUF2232 domain-containing protein n=1 Tax=Thiomicrospira aerophila AL3 TaxID=717772 RepID=W0DS15_9GAMM|nr:DUF2232 domain-containing protein [Thiomicrospira aerophila]AHF01222.1 hypothetical protein THIAE_04930 [Thiomicrospira aerophila AL3]